MGLSRISIGPAVLFSFFLLSSLLTPLVFCSSENWEEVARFTDERIWLIHQYTEPFTIDHVDWRVRWEVVSLLFNMTDMSFYVVPQENYNPHLFRENMSIVIGHGTTTNGTLNITSNPGTYYLWTGTSHAKYTLIVEQNIDSIQEFPEENRYDLASYYPLIILIILISGVIIGLYFSKIRETRTNEEKNNEQK